MFLRICTGHAWHKRFALRKSLKRYLYLLIRKTHAFRRIHFQEHTTIQLSAVFICTNHLNAYFFISSPEIPLANITKAHLVAYDPDKDILPMILANCDYSLRIGGGTMLEFNWKCLERQLVDRFIRGKPRLPSLVKFSLLLMGTV